MDGERRVNDDWVAGSVGHFIAEEESGLTAKSVAQFYQQLQGSG